MSATIYGLNGEIVPEEQAVVSIADRGLLYGDGLFETMHAYGEKIFRLREHLRRLRAGAEKLFFSPLPDIEQLAAFCEKAAAAAYAAGNREANVRLSVTRGVGPRGPSIGGQFKQTTTIIAAPHRRPDAAEWERGQTAVWASFRRQETAVTATLKTLNYLEQILARREADQAGAGEALLLNNAGLVCEGSMSNVTLVRNGALTAPDPRAVGALPGLAQEAVFETARALGIPVRFASLCPGDLYAATETFTTGSMREITPLLSVAGHRIGTGMPGPLTRKIFAAYLKLVERELAVRIAVKIKN
jgi:branched-chain amino acid aminotransferase